MKGLRQRKLIAGTQDPGHGPHPTACRNLLEDDAALIHQSIGPSGDAGSRAGSNECHDFIGAIDFERPIAIRGLAVEGDSHRPEAAAINVPW